MKTHSDRGDSQGFFKRDDDAVGRRKVNFVFDAGIRSYFDADPFPEAPDQRPAHDPPDPEVAPTRAFAADQRDRCGLGKPNLRLITTRALRPEAKPEVIECGRRFRKSRRRCNSECISQSRTGEMAEASRNHAMHTFHRVTDLRRRSLRRRSQKDRMTLEQDQKVG